MKQKKRTKKKKEQYTNRNRAGSFKISHVSLLSSLFSSFLAELASNIWFGLGVSRTHYSLTDNQKVNKLNEENYTQTDAVSEHLNPTKALAMHETSCIRSLKLNMKEMRALKKEKRKKNKSLLWSDMIFWSVIFELIFFSPNARLISFIITELAAITYSERP